MDGGTARTALVVGDRNRKGLLILVGLGACGLGALSLLFFCNPADSGLYPLCPFHALTGGHCPGCGSMRALHQLLHGNFAEAMRLNALLVLSLPLISFMFLKACLSMIRRDGRPFQYPRTGTMWVVVIVVLVYWVLRNIPCHPFTLLAPE